MSKLPPKAQQIVQSHATLIIAAVQAAQSGKIHPDLEQGLQVSAQNGWTALVGTIRKIISGERSASLLQPLDEEDRIIAEAVLNGIQDPATLPNPDKGADATMAAPGLAVLIHAARSGQQEALTMLAGMAEQMTAAGGDMAKIGGAMRRLVDGERDLETLTKGMGKQGISLMNSIIEELAKLDLH